MVFRGNKVLAETLMNIFKNVILNKTKRIDYKTPKWMNSKVNSSLKARKKTR